MRNRYIEIWKEINKDKKPIKIIDIGGRNEELLKFKPKDILCKYKNFDIKKGEDIEKKIKEKEKFDIIIFSHVIEHLTDKKTALINIRKMMHKKSRLILLTPNSLSWRRIIFYIFNKRMESYGGYETHLCCFNIEVLKNLLERFSFKIEKIKFYDFFLPFNLGKFSEEIMVVCKK
ncbi:MAG: methyltransferase domain-containing protein [Candidatus Pacearchaeota archaeon]